ncbi:hypothetical protein [Cesiribacter andamanensis]|uniref:Uncharacterized protein n=1 Tax=Cesiribacter andamanensis AMV16 TaxID=1279009 RepID=M7MXW0_9BACT|nr:hypothetical protein [Cesiribacter andamanensis]EMR01263.1 hypothetical protein ADICEAN_03612 [Cesiribacter andamanensis AMV16]
MAAQELQAPLLLPADGGPVYAETDLSRPLVEPWNAVSSLAILLPAVYWALRLRGQYRQHPFLALCLPLLFLGGLGSTLYHAFRSHRLWLMLDITPTALLTLLLALFFLDPGVAPQVAGHTGGSAHVSDAHAHLVGLSQPYGH